MSSSVTLLYVHVSILSFLAMKLVHNFTPEHSVLGLYSKTIGQNRAQQAIKECIRTQGESVCITFDISIIAVLSAMVD